MSGTEDIGYLGLVVAFLGLLLPIGMFWYYRIKLIPTFLIGALRMVLQLLFVGFYLEWIFKENSALLNVAWVVVMILVSSFTIINRVRLNWRYFMWALVIAATVTVFLVDAFFLGVVIQLENVFDARYFIPITGMLLGNAMNQNIITLSTYFDELNSKSELYYYILVNANSRKKALNPFISSAIKRGLNPMIASMSVMGLISLPGMMTGQILGGSSPAVAIKYQIMIMVAILVGASITIMITIAIVNTRIFNAFGTLQKDAFKKK